MPEHDRPHVLMMSEITVDGKLTLKRGGASSKILMKYMAPPKPNSSFTEPGRNTMLSW